MKIIIAGCRNFYDVETVYNAIIESGFNITEVCCGGAKGVDACGKILAEQANVPVKMFHADWKRFGKAAGPMRNQDMADYADGLIAVWDKKSKGTRDMIHRMSVMKKEIFTQYVDL